MVSWQSKALPSVTLSSTKAEYVAPSMCAQEIKFVSTLLHEIAPNHVERPSILREDNTGAIFTAQNHQIGARTKHIDVKFHHVKDMVEDGELELRFVRLEHNFADLMTKNVSKVIHTTLLILLMDATRMSTTFGGHDEEGVKNLVVAAGLDLGRVDLVNPSSATSEWTTVVRRNTKSAVGGRTVTWAELLGLKEALLVMLS